jgi:Ala-tRNA(Pro) deacylase
MGCADAVGLTHKPLWEVCEQTATDWHGLCSCINAEEDSSERGYVWLAKCNSGTYTREVNMPVRPLQEFLARQNVKYATITHSPAYTAQEMAASAHIPGKEVAKSVVVKLDGTLAMAVLPASYQVDFVRMKDAAGAHAVELAREEEFKDRFPACEVGAIPPFGNLYGLPVFVDERLAEDEEIACKAGTHSELMRLAYRDFARIVQPTVVNVAVTGGS